MSVLVFYSIQLNCYRQRIPPYTPLKGLAGLFYVVVVLKDLGEVWTTHTPTRPHRCLYHGWELIPLNLRYESFEIWERLLSSSCRTDGSVQDRPAAPSHLSLRSCGQEENNKSDKIQDKSIPSTSALWPRAAWPELASGRADEAGVGCLWVGWISIRLCCSRCVSGGSTVT